MRLVPALLFLLALTAPVLSSHVPGARGLSRGHTGTIAKRAVTRASSGTSGGLALMEPGPRHLNHTASFGPDHDKAGSAVLELSPGGTNAVVQEFTFWGLTSTYLGSQADGTASNGATTITGQLTPSSDANTCVQIHGLDATRAPAHFLQSACVTDDTDALAAQTWQITQAPGAATQLVFTGGPVADNTPSRYIFRPIKNAHQSLGALPGPDNGYRLFLQ